MKFGIYQRTYVEDLQAEVARLRRREEQLLNTAFSLHGISAPFAPPRLEENMKPMGRKSWLQKKADLEASESQIGRPESYATSSS